MHVDNGDDNASGISSSISDSPRSPAGRHAGTSLDEWPAIDFIDCERSGCYWERQTLERVGFVPRTKPDRQGSFGPEEECLQIKGLLIQSLKRTHMLRAIAHNQPRRSVLRTAGEPSKEEERPERKTKHIRDSKMQLNVFHRAANGFSINSVSLI